MHAAAPSARVASFAQAISGSTAPKPAKVPKPQSEPAITRSAADDIDEALEALRNELGMLDEVRRGVDDAGDEDLVVGDLGARSRNTVHSWPWRGLDGLEQRVARARFISTGETLAMSMSQTCGPS